MDDFGYYYCFDWKSWRFNYTDAEDIEIPDWVLTDLGLI